MGVDKREQAGEKYLEAAHALDRALAEQGLNLEVEVNRYGIVLRLGGFDAWVLTERLKK